MNFPQNLKYTNEHEWIRVDGDIAYVGITDYAQEQLGDIVFVDIPTVGETLEAPHPACDVPEQCVQSPIYRQSK